MAEYQIASLVTRVRFLVGANKFNWSYEDTLSKDLTNKYFIKHFVKYLIKLYDAGPIPYNS